MSALRRGACGPGAALQRSALVKRRSSWEVRPRRPSVGSLCSPQPRPSAPAAAPGLSLRVCGPRARPVARSRLSPFGTPRFSESGFLQMRAALLSATQWLPSHRDLAHGGAVRVPSPQTFEEPVLCSCWLGSSFLWVPCSVTSGSWTYQLLAFRVPPPQGRGARPPCAVWDWGPRVSCLGACKAVAKPATTKGGCKKTGLTVLSEGSFSWIISVSSSKFAFRTSS